MQVHECMDFHFDNFPRQVQITFPGEIHKIETGSAYGPLKLPKNHIADSFIVYRTMWATCNVVLWLSNPQSGKMHIHHNVYYKDPINLPVWFIDMVITHRSTVFNLNISL